MNSSHYPLLPLSWLLANSRTKYASWELLALPNDSYLTKAKRKPFIKSVKLSLILLQRYRLKLLKPVLIITF